MNRLDNGPFAEHELIKDLHQARFHIAAMPVTKRRSAFRYEELRQLSGKGPDSPTAKDCADGFSRRGILAYYPTPEKSQDAVDDNMTDGVSSFRAAKQSRNPGYSDSITRR